MPEASRPVISPASSRERSALALGLVEATVAERERRAVVLGDVQP